MVDNGGAARGCMRDAATVPTAEGRSMSPIRRVLDRVYWWLSDRITPGLVNSQHRYLATLRGRLTPRTRWLDLGCGRRIVPDWLPLAAQRDAALVASVGLAVGIDVDPDSLRDNAVLPARVRGDLHRQPFADDSFDVVTANMVVEHVSDPVALLAEVRRVLAPGGSFIFHTPNLHHPPILLAALLPQWLKNAAARVLENRPGKDVFPTLYRLNTRRDIERVGAAAGLSVSDVGLVDSSTVTAMLGPLAAFELLFIRLLRWRPLRGLRGNVIAVLTKPDTAAETQRTLRRAA
jgi:SAM-dependent methyltransferase